MKKTLILTLLQGLLLFGIADETNPPKGSEEDQTEQRGSAAEVLGVPPLAFDTRAAVRVRDDGRFWQPYLEGDYAEAAEAAASMGEELPAYYALAAVCYQQVGEYSKSTVMKYLYSRSDRNLDKLAWLL